MRKGLRIWLVSLAVIIGAIFVLRLWRERADTVYDGHPLSVWLEALGPRGSDRIGRVEAEEELGRIGTNAIPMLLAMLRKEDSVETLKFVAFAQGQHLLDFHYIPAADREATAAEGFRVLRERASNAVPDLIRMYNPTNLELQVAIVTSLGYIGPPAKSAIPLLLSSAQTNIFFQVKTMSISALGSIHSAPEIVLPALVKLIRDSDGSSRMPAILAVSGFGADAGPAIPSIIERLADPDGQVSASAVITLGRFYSKPEWYKLRVTQGKWETPSETLVRVINGFGTLGKNAEAAVPALVKFLASTNEGVRMSATNALKAINADAAGRGGVQ